ncbi:hypothetical protein DFJ74DRAFT_770554 [Hyaloraphidium curvatum]|nr:hypothetical protein DFJ74DRAFT_770554 [Hyaloraphidium curvatum]
MAAGAVTAALSSPGGSLGSPLSPTSSAFGRSMASLVSSFKAHNSDTLSEPATPRGDPLNGDPDGLSSSALNSLNGLSGPGSPGLLGLNSPMASLGSLGSLGNLSNLSGLASPGGFPFPGFGNYAPAAAPFPGLGFGSAAQSPLAGLGNPYLIGTAPQPALYGPLPAAAPPIPSVPPMPPLVPAQQAHPLQNMQPVQHADFMFGGLAQPAHEDPQLPYGRRSGSIAPGSGSIPAGSGSIPAGTAPGAVDATHVQTTLADEGGFAFGMEYGTALPSPTSLVRAHNQAFDMPAQAKPDPDPSAADDPLAMAVDMSRPASRARRGSSASAVSTSTGATRKRAREPSPSEELPLPPPPASPPSPAPAPQRAFTIPNLTLSSLFSDPHGRSGEEWDDDDPDPGADGSALFIGHSRLPARSPSMSPGIAPTPGTGSDERSLSPSLSHRSTSPGAISPRLIDGSVSPRMIEGDRPAALQRHKKSASSSNLQTTQSPAAAVTRSLSGSMGGPAQPKIGIRRNSSLSILTSRMALVPPASRDLAPIAARTVAEPVPLVAEQARSDPFAAFAQHHAPESAPAPAPPAPLQPSLNLILGDFMDSLRRAQDEERAAQGLPPDTPASQGLGDGTLRYAEDMLMSEPPPQPAAFQQAHGGSGAPIPVGYGPPAYGMPGVESPLSYASPAVVPYQPPRIIQLPNGQFAQLTSTVPQGAGMVLVPSVVETGQQIYGVAMPSAVPLQQQQDDGMHPRPAGRHLVGSRTSPYPAAVSVLPAGPDPTRARSRSPAPPIGRSNSLPADLALGQPAAKKPRPRNPAVPRVGSNPMLLPPDVPIVLPPDHNPMAAATAIVANRKPQPITGPAPPGATSGPAGTHTPSGKAKTFRCELCPQTFSRSHDLKRHTGIHTGIRPFQCEKCGRAFSRRDALARHHKNEDCEMDGDGEGEMV